MTREVKTTKKVNDGMKVTIVKTVTETDLSQADLMQRKNQFHMQQQGVLRQMQNLKNQYEALTKDIAELDELLAGFTQEVPTI